MGGPEPAKKSSGSQCTNKGECSSNICAKPCAITSSAWKRIKDVDNFNRRGFCFVSGYPKTSLVCIDSSQYNRQILLNADGTINHRGNPAGSKSRWNKDQCIEGVNCDGQYTPSKTNAICAQSSYLKGFKWATKDACQKNCDERSGCKTFCWSDKSPHWDCLTYTSCSGTDSKFSDGKSTSSYNCWNKPVGNEEAMSLTMADGPDMDTLAVDAFAIIGVVCVLLMIFHRLTRFVTKTSSTANKTFTAEPTETTALEISHPEVL